jgi:chorismate lyase / 3-hydroxybenzoate synthase
MAPDPRTCRCSYQLAYETDSDTATDDDVLARISYGSGVAAHRDPRCIHVALPQLDTPAVAEVWRSRLPVEHGRAGGCGYAHNGEVLFGHLRLEREQIAELDRATTRAYLCIDRLLCRLGYPCRLRMWNFVSHINRGDGDAERYRQFSQGRHDALARMPGFETRLPAATAIGSDDDGMTVCFLAAREPGAQVENPRQVSAFRYPVAYGPRSPSFSRASLKRWGSGIDLFVSGTASVVGHRTQHPGEPLAQLDETWRNFDALLLQAATLEPAAGPFRAAGLKIFVRCREHWPALLPRMHQLFGADVPLLGLVGDICRRDLLLEIEGLFTAAPLAASLRVAA